MCGPPDEEFAKRLAEVGAERVPMGRPVTSEVRARAAAVAGTIRTDGATATARLLLDGVG